MSKRKSTSPPAAAAAASSGGAGAAEKKTAKRARFNSEAMATDPDECMRSWQVEEEIAESMIPVIGRLYRRDNVICTLFNHSLTHQSPVDLIRLYSESTDHRGRRMNITRTWPVLQALQHMPMTPMRIDLGSLTLLVERAMSQGGVRSVANEVQKWVSKSADKTLANPMLEARDVVLYGFGRIGRLVARLLIEKTGSGAKLRLRAIVVRRKKDPDLAKRASLLFRDSVHKDFKGRVVVNEEENCIIANGNMIKLLYSNSPSEIDYTAHGISNAVIVDNTGIWRDRKGLSQHLQAPGASAVVLTAPGKGGVPNIVMGVNDEEIFSSDGPLDILSAASCSTNAVVPVLKLMGEGFGVEGGHLETIHAFTNDQNLIDNYHKKARRGRSAVLNMVLTETGAAKAVAKCLPEFAGKLTASAIRVPTPDVSMALLSLTLSRKATKAEVQKFLLERATRGPLMHQVMYSNSTEAVSTDFVGSRAASVIDGPNTIVDGQRCNLYVWYDNEFGYSCQVMRLLQRMCQISHPPCPPVLLQQVESEAEMEEDDE